jgi:sodium-dependent dicarboxylate transporter 2/3/5
VTALSGPVLRALLCVLLAAGVHAAVPGSGGLNTGLALFALIGSLWVTQALHPTATALLVPLLAVLGGLLSVPAALAPFAHPVIFLFLGGFALAAALQYQGLDRALAQRVLRLARGRRALAVLLLFLLTAALSMWISNTATAAMMVPLALGLLRGPDDADAASADAAIGPREQAFVLLGVAYAANIGGIGTLVGSPPNAIAAAAAGISFAQWLQIGLPAVALLLPLMIGVLFLLLRPRLGGRVAVACEPLVWTRGRRVTVIVFALTAAGWVFAAPLARALGVAADIDSVVALAAVFALLALGAIDWPHFERSAHWDVLLLFGGGLALGRVMEVSGGSRFLADALVQQLHGAPPLLVLLGVVAFVVFLTELVSNTAVAALLVPPFLVVGDALGLPGPLLAGAIAVAASCAFMLPVATPPNAIVYGTGQVPQATMMRCGLVLNLVCIGAVAAAALLAFG